MSHLVYITLLGETEGVTLSRLACAENGMKIIGDNIKGDPLTSVTLSRLGWIPFGKLYYCPPPCDRHFSGSPPPTVNSCPFRADSHDGPNPQKSPPWPRARSRCARSGRAGGHGRCCICARVSPRRSGLLACETLLVCSDPLTAALWALPALWSHAQRYHRRSSPPRHAWESPGETTLHWKSTFWVVCMYLGVLLQCHEHPMCFCAGDNKQTTPLVPK